LPLIQWTTIRLVVSENDWRRHDRKMEPREEKSLSSLCTRRRTRAFGPRKVTLRSKIHLQPVGLNAEAKRSGIEPRRRYFS
jgi:hypothetical protein